MKDNEYTLLDYWNIIWQNKKTIIIVVMTVSIVTAGITLILPKWYKATSVIMPPKVEQNVLGSLGGADLSAIGIGGMMGANQSQIRLLTILKSRKMLEILNNEYNFQERYDTEYRFQAYEKIESNLEIVVGDEDQIKITFYDKNQVLVAEMVQLIVEKLDSLNIALSTSQAKKNRNFIKNRVNLIQDSLRYYENELASFMKKNDIITMEEQLRAEVEKAAEMKAQIMFDEIKLDVMRGKLKDSNPKVVDLETQIRLLKKKYHGLFSPSHSDELFINLDKTPDLQKRFGQLQRRVLYYSKLIEFLGPRYEQAKIEAVKDVPTIQVIDEPRRPEYKAKPRRALIVIILMISSFIITVVAIISNHKIKKYYN